MAKTGVIVDAIDRVVQTLGGNPQPGVALDPTTGTGTVTMDMDGDGTDDMTVAGSVALNDPSIGIAGGAILSIGSVTSPSVESGSGTAFLSAASPTALTLSASSVGTPSASFRSVHGTTIETHDIDVTADFGASPIVGHALSSAPILAGFLHFHVLRDGVKIEADMILEPDGSGGFRVRVVSEDGGIDFTIP